MNVPPRLAQLKRMSPGRTLFTAVRHRNPRVIVGPGFRLINTGSFQYGRGLRLGAGEYGFTLAHEVGVLRNRGRVSLGDGVVIGPGNRWDVGPDATVSVGDNTYFSPFARVVSSHSITVGSNCAIAWEVQLLDDDFHTYHPEEGVTPPRSAPIVIGDHVWIGSRVAIFKGVELAPGTIVAGGSVVTRSVTEPNCLVGGVPARVLRRGVSWE